VEVLLMMRGRLIAMAELSRPQWAKRPPGCIGDEQKKQKFITTGVSKNNAQMHA